MMDKCIAITRKFFGSLVFIAGGSLFGILLILLEILYLALYSVWKLTDYLLKKLERR